MGRAPPGGPARPRRKSAVAQQRSIIVSIDFNLGAIEIQFLTPDQASLLALFDNMLEETSEGLHSITVMYPRLRVKLE